MEVALFDRQRAAGRGWSGMGSQAAGPTPRFVMDRCPPAERQRAEDIVKDTLCGRDCGEMWMVSLQRFHGGWDVFIEGPDPMVAALLAETLKKAGFTR
jgi:hypothetical protein